METVIEKKRGGNPNWAKKKVLDTDLDRVFEFELVKTHDIYKPEVVLITGKHSEKSVGKSDSVYPPMVAIPNAGLAYDEENNKQRAWRFISTENSIWIDEQRDLSKDEEGNILSLPENQLEFVDGMLRVRGVEKNKIAALMIQDLFEGKKVKLRQQPPLFRLLNPDAILKATQDILDKSYEAEKAAREANLEQMYEFASVLGIKMTQSDDGIRKDFIVRAKANPDYFLKHFVNPKNKYIYSFSQAIKDGLLIVNKDSGKLLWKESGQDIVSVNAYGDVSDELAKRAVEGETTVLGLFETLSKM